MNVYLLVTASGARPLTPAELERLLAGVSREASATKVTN